MIKETSNQLKARARGTLLGHYGLPIGASILTTAAIMTLEGLISLVVPKNTAGVLISYLTMLIAAIFSTLPGSPGKITYRPMSPGLHLMWCINSSCCAIKNTSIK